jgi:hypothetical protein
MRLKAGLVWGCHGRGPVDSSRSKRPLSETRTAGDERLVLFGQRVMVGSHLQKRCLLQRFHGVWRPFQKRSTSETRRGEQLAPPSLCRWPRRSRYICEGSSRLSSVVSDWRAWAGMGLIIC